MDRSIYCWVTGQFVYMCSLRLNNFHIHVYCFHIALGIFQLSGQVRSSMKQFSGDIQKLKSDLIRATSSYHMYP